MIHIATFSSRYKEQKLATPYKKHMMWSVLTLLIRIWVSIRCRVHGGFLDDVHGGDGGRLGGKKGGNKPGAI